MGSRIVDQPKSSAMLAYGTSRGFRINTRLLALVAGSLAFIGLIAALLLSSQLPVPPQTLLLISARPSTLHRNLSIPLKQDLPAPWREAIATKSRLPVLFGLALDNERRVRPFAIVPRTSFVMDTSGLQVETRGLYRLLSMETLLTTGVRAHALATTLGAAFTHDASFHLRGDLLEGWALERVIEPDANTIIRGVWDEGMGQLLIEAESPTSSPATDAPLFVSLSGAHDGHAPITAGLLYQGIDLRTMSVSPNMISLALSPLGNRTLTLAWDHDLSDTHRRALALAQGNTSLSPMLLPDGTDASEIVSPISPFPMAEERRVTFSESVTTTADAPPESLVTDCPGMPRFILEGIALENTLTAIQFPSSWRNTLSHFSLRDDREAVILCVR
ncbi:MAG: hypothetical protein RL141_3 [Candidatus Parcubacteria bacterium]|jgi:hypothetical protein